MVPSADAEGKRALSIFLSTNMSGHSDEHISLPLNAGCSGLAFKKAAQTFWHREISQTRGKFALPKGVVSQVANNLDCILATPIPHPENNRRLLGVFSVDSFSEADRAMFVDAKYQQCCRVVAAYLGHLLAPVSDEN